MNPYETLGVVADIAIEELHIAYNTRFKELSKNKQRLLGLADGVSIKEWTAAYVRKLDAIDPQDPATQPDQDEEWSDNQRNLELLERAYGEICGSLRPHEILGVDAGASIVDILSACGLLLQKEAASPLVCQAFTDMFVAIEEREFYAQQREESRTRRRSVFGPNPSRHELELERRTLIDGSYKRKNAYKDESYQLWTRLELTYGRRG